MQNFIGTVLANRYRVESVLGRGGMAEVYKVWDLQRSTYLAVKVLNEDLAIDRVFIRRFRREAQTLAKLQHPHIVRFYGLEQDGPRAFILLDYIDGKSLKRVIFDQGGPVPLAHIEIIFHSICAALQYAHAEGLVHCDMKPGNVMVDRKGDVLVADFGIARMSDAATATMVGMGTPAYMAPEQARGLDPVPQTDIYALGIILFEMLTGGERPFTGENAQTTGTTSERVRWEQINLEPPSPRQWNPAITPELVGIVFKCLAKDPKVRYQTPLELLNDLQRTLDAMGIVSAENSIIPIEIDESEAPTNLEPHPLPAESERRPVTKQPWFWPLVGVVIVATIFLFANGERSAPAEQRDGAAGNVEAESLASIEEETSPIVSDSGKVSPPSDTSTVITASTQTPTQSATSALMKTPTKRPTATPSQENKAGAKIYAPISGCAQSRIHVGDSIFVTEGGTGNYVRTSPDVGSKTNVIEDAYSNQGDVLLVVGGPECSYDWILWEVIAESGVRGWTAESDGSKFWLDVIPTEDVCSGTLPTRLNVGDTAHVGIYPPSANTVRAQHDNDSQKVGTINPGERIKILDGHECSDRMVWWKIRSLKTGLEGWTSEGNISGYWLVPEP